MTWYGYDKNMEYMRRAADPAEQPYICERCGDEVWDVDPESGLCEDCEWDVEQERKENIDDA